MRALAWDDKKKELLGLIAALRKYNIAVEFEAEKQKFTDRLLNEQWDFVITDLIDERDPLRAGEDPAGKKNAERALTKVPLVFMVTAHPTGAHALNLPDNVIIKSKDVEASWLAHEIYEALKQRGLFIDYKKVFVIYGHDTKADGATGFITNRLNECNLTPVMGTTETMPTIIVADLIELIRPCAAIIAVCTPDDKLSNGLFVPRGNVLFEMGMATGLARGLERLIILQKWGPSVDEQAQLPSDFGGRLTIRFQTNIENAWNPVESRLRTLRVLPKVV